MAFKQTVDHFYGKDEDSTKGQGFLGSVKIQIEKRSQRVVCPHHEYSDLCHQRRLRLDRVHCRLPPVQELRRNELFVDTTIVTHCGLAFVCPAVLVLVT